MSSLAPIIAVLWALLLASIALLIAWHLGREFVRAFTASKPEPLSPHVPLEAIRDCPPTDLDLRRMAREDRDDSA